MPNMLRHVTISGVPRVLVVGVVTDSRSALVVLAQLRVLGVARFSRGYDRMALMMLMISHGAQRFRVRFLVSTKENAESLRTLHFHGPSWFVLLF
jgi:hypothetical protein